MSVSIQRPYAYDKARAIALVKHIVLLSIVCIQGALFLSGYRSTSDQTVAHYISMQGLTAILNHTLEAAKSSGRVSFFFMPLFLGAELLADYSLVRALYVVLFFAIFVVFSLYWCKLVRNEMFSFVVLLFVSMQILDYNNMSPNCYNINFTLPLFVLICARYGMLRLEDRQKSLGRLKVFSLFIIVLLCYLSTDYVLIFGVSMLIMEYLLLVVRGGRLGMAAAKSVVFRKKTLLDASSLLVAVLAYYFWRMLNPPWYTGYVVADGMDMSRVLHTLLSHASGAFSFARSDLYAISLSLAYLSGVNILFLVYIFLATTALAAILLYTSRSIAHPVTTLFGSLFLACFVSLPLALTPKYQGLDLKAYCDSRFAYLWGCSAIACAIYLLYAAFARYAGKTGAIVLGACIGAVSAFSYYHNVDMCRLMLQDASVWERARALAVTPDADHSLNDAQTIRYIDPLHFVGHPDVDMKDYWRRYVKWYQNRKDDPLINWNPTLLDSLPVALQPNVLYKVSSLPRSLLRRNGWSLPEAWGVRHIGSSAFFTFTIVPSSRDATLVFTAYGLMDSKETHKSVAVTVDGKLVQHVNLVDELCAYEIRVPEHMVRSERVTVAFTTAQPANADPTLTGVNTQPFFGLVNIGLIN